MLNRKISNYIFYGGLVLIAAIVLLVRSVTLGNINTKIEVLEISNISLQKTNDELEKQVEEYKDVQINHLYELYDKVPNYFSQTELAFFTTAQLEGIGIDSSIDYQRTVNIETEVRFNDESIFGKLESDFKIVEIKVYFTVLDESLIEEFIDLLYNSEQVFIVSSIEYTLPGNISRIGVSISFYAFYDIEEVTEDAS